MWHSVLQLEPVGMKKAQDSSRQKQPLGSTFPSPNPARDMDLGVSIATGNDKRKEA